MSSCSVGRLSARSPPLSAAFSHISSMLDAAAEEMMVNRDFQAALDTCDRGLESLGSVEPEDSRCEELKAGFCILGIQALAELNQWQDVLSWVLQQYEHQEKIPARIMQMCILLYSKVGHPAVMQEASRVWLICPLNGGASGFRTVAELYLLHILLPLGCADEARGLISGEVGDAAFTEDQRQTVLDVLEEQERRDQEATFNPNVSPSSEITARPEGRLSAMLRFFYRKVMMCSSGSFPLRSLFLAAILIYMLFIRLDPAFPSSFMWISKLYQLLRQMWNVLFAPYYQSKEL